MTDDNISERAHKFIEQFEYELLLHDSLCKSPQKAYQTVIAKVLKKNPKKFNKIDARYIADYLDLRKEEIYG